MGAGHVSGIATAMTTVVRSEEHTSELQSLRHLVCRLLLEKKKKNNRFKNIINDHIPSNTTRTPHKPKLTQKSKKVKRNYTLTQQISNDMHSVCSDNDHYAT